ncbi:AEC family transporter [Pullulanibacillus sp. KACC 23026]|uniref:AEC family transporter n=1 Tax=Pullulanibacillus sp. KACC 23026 TaxID=3028315 RepID=UPI0023AF57CF|nr:AEC family transporter [Pullulanibacillus sp. KACC 23026]WEG15051.1 AEC family transporter [Pullulanibacillus sp. KACC 23026]
MNVLFLILIHIILPIFLLIAAGAWLHRLFKFDMNTLSKINTYLLMPAVSFANLYQSKMGGAEVIHVIGFLLLQNLCMIILSSGLSRLFKFERSLSSTFKNSVVLMNSGNFGLPVSQLVFEHNPLGASVQVVVLIVQNLLTYTYGLYNALSVRNKGFGAIKVFLKMPVIYAFLLGLFFHSFSIKLPDFLWSPIKNVSNAFVAIALITLGAQSAFLKISRFSFPLILTLIVRLLVSPCLALLIIIVLHLHGVIAQALLIASSFPTNRNSSLFALEYNNHPEYAAQAVLVSTLFSIITVTIVVYASQLLFP